VAWVISYSPTQVFKESDLTIGECERMELETGKSWRVLHPVNSATQAKGILVVLLESRSGMTLEQARTEVSALQQSAFLDMLSDESADADLPATYEDGFPTKAGDLSTPG
jgi:hypothetical protein